MARTGLGRTRPEKVRGLVGDPSRRDPDLYLCHIILPTFFLF